VQRNLRVHLAICLAVIVVGGWLGLDALRWAVLVLTMGLVLGLEMVNSAIEALGDAVSIEDHPLVGHAKDAAAGAVLLGALVAVVVGLLVLGPPLWQRLFGAA
jgi:diacylglycerol kinase